MTEIVQPGEVESNPVIDEIKSLGFYEEYLKTQMGETTPALSQTDLPPEVRRRRRRNTGRSTSLRMAGHVLHKPSVAKELPLPTEIDTTPVTLLEVQSGDDACRTAEPELFYPVGVSSLEAKQAIREAKAICLGCAVLEKCRTYALQNKEEFGIWGGLTENERKEVWRRQKQL